MHLAKFDCRLDYTVEVLVDQSDTAVVQCTMPIVISHPNQADDILMVIDIEDPAAQDRDTARYRKQWAEYSGVYYYLLKHEDWVKDIDGCMQPMLQKLSNLIFSPN